VFLHYLIVACSWKSLRAESLPDTEQVTRNQSKTKVNTASIMQISLLYLALDHTSFIGTRLLYSRGKALLKRIWKAIMKVNISCKFLCLWISCGP